VAHLKLFSMLRVSGVIRVHIDPPPPQGLIMYAGRTSRYILKEDRITVSGVMSRTKFVPQVFAEGHVLLLQAALV